MIDQFFNLKIIKLALLIKDDFEKTDFPGICTQMSFYLLMAFFPLLIFLISFVGNVVSQFETYLYDILKTFLPNLSYDYVVDLLNSLISEHSNNRYLLLMLSFFFATLAARAIMIGLNQTYGQNETRSHLKIWFLSFVFTLLFAFSILMIVSAYIFTADLGKFIFQFFNYSSHTYGIWSFFATLFSWLISTLIFNMIYVIAPAQHLKFIDGFPGAIFSTLGLNIAFRIFALFINNSTKYTTLYGNLGGLFALLVGIYFICVVLNLGGKINIYWSNFKKQTL
jgi:membrane protein